MANLIHNKSFRSSTALPLNLRVSRPGVNQLMLVRLLMDCFLLDLLLSLQPKWTFTVHGFVDMLPAVVMQRNMVATRWTGGLQAPALAGRGWKTLQASCDILGRLFRGPRLRAAFTLLIQLQIADVLKFF